MQLELLFIIIIIHEGAYKELIKMATSTITASNGFSVTTIDTGASVTAVRLPNGANVVLGFQDLNVYKSNPPYIGCTVGRCTNRTGGAKCTIDGKEYQLSANAPPNQLHGGEVGFNKLTWKLESTTDTSVTYSLLSPDGDQGYPGNLSITATYSVTSDNEVIIEYRATTDAPTAVNLTNHTYFNLAGQGDILGHVLVLNADNYTPTESEGFVPTGVTESIKGTILDFTEPHSIGERSAQVKPRGYDANYVLNTAPKYDKDDKLHFVGRLEDPGSKSVILEVYTNQPCVQLYMGGYLDGTLLGSNGQPIHQYHGLCLETQKHPNAVNEPNFPTTVIRPDQEYYSKTVWKFICS